MISNQGGTLVAFVFRDILLIDESPFGRLRMVQSKNPGKFYLGADCAREYCWRRCDVLSQPPPRALLLPVTVIPYQLYTTWNSKKAGCKADAQSFVLFR